MHDHSPLPTSHSQLPFQPAEGESPRAFEAFLAYFDIGQNRSFHKVAQLTQTTFGTVQLWARRYQWRTRIHAYNTFLLQTRIAAETGVRRDQAQSWAERMNAFREKEWAASQKLLHLAERIIHSFETRNPKEISLTELARALEVASKLGRLAAGMATEHQEHSGPNGLPIPLEISAALDKIYGPKPAVIDLPPVGTSAPSSPIPSVEQPQNGTGWNPSLPEKGEPPAPVGTTSTSSPSSVAGTSAPSQ